MGATFTSRRPRPFFRPVALPGIAARSIARLMVMLALCVLAGCDNTPTRTQLAADLTGYLDRGYAPGLFEITRTERLDHQVVPDFRRDRRVVTYRADLRLRRAYDFGTWDQANAAGLVLLLGAPPTAVSGVKSDGNRAGDALHVVVGRIVYEQRDGSWMIASGANDLPLAAGPPDRLALLKSWRDYTALTFQALFDPAQPRANLVESAAAARALAVRAAGGIAVAGGEPGGDAWRVIRAIAGADPQVMNVATRGPEENIQLLRRGVVSAAVLRADEAQMAAQGLGPFEAEGSFPDLRALASLYPEKIHVAVNAKSSIASVAELFGKRVAVAGASPAAMTEAGDVLRAHRVTLNTLQAAPQQLPLVQALTAVARGEQDAVIFTAAAPSPDLATFVGANGLRLLPLDGDAVALLTTGTSNYITATIPAQTYPGQERSVTTVGLAALLVSRANVTAEEVLAVLQHSLAPGDALKQGSPLNALVKFETSRQGLTLPLHSAAEAFYAPVLAPK